MLPKSLRIPRKLFSQLKNGGKTFKNRLFLLKFAPNQEKDEQKRFTFSVSKKISKSAVVRNKLRRLGYRLLKPLISEIKPNILASFSFLRVPIDIKDADENLKSILLESRLL